MYFIGNLCEKSAELCVIVITHKKTMLNFKQKETKH